MAASVRFYKDGRIANKQEINQASFLRRMVELHQESRDSRDLVANLKGELSSQRIQVFTPKGDLRSLPEDDAEALVDSSAGKAVRWVPGEGWVEGRE